MGAWLKAMLVGAGGGEDGVVVIIRSTGEPDPVQRCSPIRDISTCSLHDEHLTVGMKRDSLPTVAILKCTRRFAMGGASTWGAKSGSGCEVPKMTCPPGLLRRPVLPPGSVCCCPRAGPPPNRGQAAE
jgi:hypothetical protein